MKGKTAKKENWTRRGFLGGVGLSLSAAGLSGSLFGRLATETPRDRGGNGVSGLQGPMIFVTTPMVAGRDPAAVDYEGMRRNVAHLASLSGPYCLCICGGTGEFRDLTAEEIEGLTSAAAEVKGQATVIVGVGGEDTTETVVRARRLQKAGADALLAMPVASLGADVENQEAMYRHLESLCRSVEIGVIPYRASYLPLEMETIERLADIDNFVALKSADKQPEWYHELHTKTGGRLPMFPGSDFGAPYWHLAGCAGFTTGLANLVPAFCIDLWQTAEAGEYREAVEKTTRLRPLGAFRRKHGNSMIKSGLELMGLAGGPLRRTGKVLGPPEREELRGLLREMEVEV